jgi:hypothetical protein
MSERLGIQEGLEVVHDASEQFASSFLGKEVMASAFDLHERV